jgi:hypothetical protein
MKGSEPGPLPTKPGHIALCNFGKVFMTQNQQVGTAADVSQTGQTRRLGSVTIPILLMIGGFRIWRKVRGSRSTYRALDIKLNRLGFNPHCWQKQSCHCFYPKIPTSSACNFFESCLNKLTATTSKDLVETPQRHISPLEQL